MPLSPGDVITPSRLLRVLERALGLSHEVQSEVAECLADLQSANALAKARMSDGSTTLPAAEALQRDLAIESRMQGCASKLQQATDDLAQGLDEVRALAQALQQSRAKHAASEAAGALPLSAEPASGDRAVHGASWAVDAVRAGAAPATAEAGDGASDVIRVLVAEDDGFMRDLVQRVLVTAGMHVTSYGSADELLRAGNLASATILLLDVKMPGMSGLELHDLLRQRGVNLPVVFISGASDLSMAVTAMRNGAADFIEKPFKGALLTERVRRAVARHAERTASASASDRLADPMVLARFETLTPREREVCDLLVTGMSSKLIARELGGSFRTIEIHRSQIMHKMAARHLSELVRMSIESMAPPKVHAR